jgi:hypothetical protein
MCVCFSLPVYRSLAHSLVRFLPYPSHPLSPNLHPPTRTLIHTHTHTHTHNFSPSPSSPLPYTCSNVEFRCSGFVNRPLTRRKRPPTQTQSNPSPSLLSLLAPLAPPHLLSPPPPQPPQNRSPAWPHRTAPLLDPVPGVSVVDERLTHAHSQRRADERCRDAQPRTLRRAAPLAR